MKLRLDWHIVLLQLLMITVAVSLAHRFDPWIGMGAGVSIQFIIFASLGDDK